MAKHLRENVELIVANRQDFHMDDLDEPDDNFFMEVDDFGSTGPGFSGLWNPLENWAEAGATAKTGPMQATNWRPQLEKSEKGFKPKRKWGETYTDELKNPTRDVAPPHLSKAVNKLISRFKRLRVNSDESDADDDYIPNSLKKYAPGQILGPHLGPTNRTI